MNRKSLILATFTFVVYFTLLTSEADAYIDPGTGSYLLQLILAGILGSLYMIKVMWHKITAFFSKLFKKTNRDDKKV